MKKHHHHLLQKVQDHRLRVVFQIHVVVAEYGSLELMQGFPLITELVQVLALSDRHLEVVQSCVHFHLVLCCRSDVHLLAAGPRDVDHDFVFVGLPGADL